MEKKTLIIIGGLVLLGIVGMRAGSYINQPVVDGLPDSSPPPIVTNDGSGDVPGDWTKFEDKNAHYSIFYPSDWMMDPALLENRELKTFATKESEPSQGLYLIQALPDPETSSLSYLDETYATEFRNQALPNTLSEERVGIRGRDAISLEAKIKNIQTQETVTSYLLLIAAKDGKPGLAITAIMRGPKEEDIAAQIRQMTVSLRFL